MKLTGFSWAVAWLAVLCVSNPAQSQETKRPNPITLAECQRAGGEQVSCGVEKNPCGRPENLIGSVSDSLCEVACCKRGEWSSLFQAISSGQRENVLQVLGPDPKKPRVNPNLRNYEKLTPLCVAIERGLPEMIALLASYSADMNSPCEGVSPTQFAIENRHPEIVKVLVANGARLEHEPVLDSVMQHLQPFDPNREKVFAEIASQVTNWNQVSKKSGVTLFQEVLNKFPSYEMVQLMLKLGADPNAKNADGTTPLSRAKSGGSGGRIVELLEGRK